jgi:hypothetical protein
LIGEKTKAKDISFTPFAFKVNSNVADYPSTQDVWKQITQKLSSHQSNTTIYSKKNATCFGLNNLSLGYIQTDIAGKMQLITVLVLQLHYYMQNWLLLLLPGAELPS